MLRVTEIKICPITLCDRLRKLQHNMTDNNEHDAAFLVDLSIETIKSLAERQVDRQGDDSNE